MDCKKMEEVILTDYIDGKVTGMRLKDVEAHLASCTRCRSLASELASVSAEFRNTKRMEPPSEVWERIRAEVNREPAVAGDVYTPGFFESMRLLAVRIRPAIVVATAAAFILAVLTVTRLMPQKELTSQDEIMSLVTMDESGNGGDYNFGTPEENYFL